MRHDHLETRLILATNFILCFFSCSIVFVLLCERSCVSLSFFNFVQLKFFIEVTMFLFEMLQMPPKWKGLSSQTCLSHSVLSFHALVFLKMFSSWSFCFVQTLNTPKQTTHWSGIYIGNVWHKNVQENGRGCRYSRLPWASRQQVAVSAFFRAFLRQTSLM